MCWDWPAETLPGSHLTRASLIPAAGAALVNASVWGIAWWPLQWLQGHGVPTLWTTVFVFAACTSVVLLARWLLHELVTTKAFVWLVLALAGAILVLGQGQSFVPVPESLADLLALVAGFCFGLNNVLLRRFAALPDDARGLAMFSGAVFCSPLAIVLAAAWASRCN